MTNEEIIDGLRYRLSKMAIKISDSVISIKRPNGDKTEIFLNFNKEEFGFLSGDLVVSYKDCQQIGICIGTGKDCPDSPDENQLLFLFEGHTDIQHFCGLRKNDFLMHEIILMKSNYI